MGRLGHGRRGKSILFRASGMLAGLIIAQASAPAVTTATWTGAGDGFAWTDPNNWTTGGVAGVEPSDSPPGDDLIFGGVGGVFTAGNHTANALTFTTSFNIVDINSWTLTLTSGSVTVSPGATGDIDVSNTLAGTLGVQLYGGGTLNLNDDNIFSGGAYIQNGTLLIAADDSLGQQNTGIFGADVLINGHGNTLEAYNSFSTSRSISLLNSGDLATAASGNVFEIDGPISQSSGSSIFRGLFVSGPGTVYLTNSSNKFTGLTVASGSTLEFSNDGALGQSGYGIYDVGELEVPANNAVSSSRAITIGVTGDSASSGAVAADTGGVFTVNGAIGDQGIDTAGDAQLIVNGYGTVVLNAANTYHGGTLINGTASISSDSNLGAANRPIAFGARRIANTPFFAGGTLVTTGNIITSRSVSITSNGATVMPAAGTGIEFSGQITGAGRLNVNGPGTVFLNGNNNTFTGGMSVTGGGTLVAKVEYSDSDALGTGPVTLAGGTLLLDGEYLGLGQGSLPLSGFNQDVVVEKGSANPQNSVTTAFDNTSKTAGYAFFESGYSGTASGHGLPAAGVGFTSNSNPQTTFQFQPYNSNNVLLLNEGASGTLTIAGNPAIRADSLSFLESAANGASPETITVNFADGTSTSFSESVPDWYTSPMTPALITSDRLNLSNDTIQQTANVPQFFEFDYTLSPGDAGKNLQSISFTNNSTVAGNALGVFAVSGMGESAVEQSFYNNNVIVENDSTIALGGGNYNSVIYVGSLTIGSQTLTIKSATNQTPYIDFLGATLTGSPTFNILANANASMYAVSGSGSVTKSGGGTLVYGGTANTYTGPTIVNAGTLMVDVTNGLPANSSATVNGGVLELYEDFNTTNVQTLSSLTIAPQGQIDLDDPSCFLYINYGSGADPIATIRQYVLNGYDGGKLDGLGGFTSTQGNRYGTGSYAIGYADSADPGNPAGLSSGTIEVRFTLLGDANLDGKVNGADFAILAANFNKAVNGWDQGDFNFDGKVNGADFAALAQNFNTGDYVPDVALLDAFAQANGLTAEPPGVPEPASAALAVGASAGIVLRRRRN
jgi:autotransporter-associated beta strand protein